MSSSIISSVSSQTRTNNLGGPFNGFSAKQTITNYKTSENVAIRKILRNSWNTPYAVGVVNNKQRVITPFRAVNNLGDYLSRKNFINGGSNQTNADKPGRKSRIGSMVFINDGTGIPSSNTNVKFVADSSDYTKFRKQQAMNVNYNDVNNGGDKNNASYVARLGIHR